MANIGEPIEIIEVEPLPAVVPNEPATEPATTPVETPVEEPVPA